jgi:hypothetical protein
VTPALVAALPYLIQYGVPALTFAAGHVAGWFHRKHVEKGADSGASQAGDAKTK